MTRVLLKFFIRLILVMLVSPMSSPASALQFEGIKKSQVEFFKKKFPDAFSDKNDLASMDQILIELTRTENYQTVELLLENGKYLVTAIPIKRIGEIKITGNNSIDSHRLLNLTKISRGERFSQSQFVELGKKINSLYLEEGFRNSKVEVKVVTTDENLVNVSILIAEGPPSKINSIRILSENSKLNEDLHDAIDSYEGENYNQKNQKQIISSIENFLSQKKYLRTKVTKVQALPHSNGSDFDLLIEIDNPYQYEFLISGTDTTEYNELGLRRKIKSSSFNKSSQEAKQFLSEFVRDQYLNLGYALAQVEVTERIDQKNFKKEQLIKVRPGKKIRISKIVLNGLFTQPEKYYIDFLLGHSSELTQKNLYNAKDIKNGLQNLEAELNNQGFLKAKVTFSQELFSSDRGSVQLVLGLSEGPMTQLIDVVFFGNSSFDSPSLRQVTGLKQNSPLQLNKLKEAIKQLSENYKNNGFLEMKILTPENEIVQYSRSNTEAKITFNIDEGPQILAQKIKTVGNHTTDSDIITRELTFKVGEILTPDKLISSQKRLFQLGIFSEIRIETLEKETDISSRTVIIHVTESKPRTIRFGAGVTNERNFTVRGYVGFRHNNLFGTARVFDTRFEVNNNIGDISYLERKLTASYLERFLLWPKNNFRASVSNETNLSQISGDDVTIEEETRLNFRFEYPLSDHLKLFSNLYDLSFQRDFKLDDGETIDENRIAQVGPTLELDYRDNVFNPTSGSFSALSIRYADPLLGTSDGIRFTKVTARSTHYWPFLGNWVWANSVRGGFVKNQASASDKGIPSDEAFFLGGRATIRGFDGLREQFPLEEEIGDRSTFEIDNYSHFGLIKSEIRFPLFSSVGGAVFYDGGYVAVSGFDFDNAYRESAGIGIHIATPVGPVNFEVGFKLDRKSEKEESPWRFHFSIGSF